MGADLGELTMRELKVLGYGTGLRAGMTGQSPKSPQLWGWGPGKGASEGVTINWELCKGQNGWAGLGAQGRDQGESELALFKELRLLT